MKVFAGENRKRLRLKERVLLDLSEKQMGDVAGGHPHPPTCEDTCEATCGEQYTCAYRVYGLRAHLWPHL